MVTTTTTTTTAATTSATTTTVYNRIADCGTTDDWRPLNKTYDGRVFQLNNSATLICE